MEKLVRGKAVLEIYGEKFELEKPKLKQTLDYQAELKKLGEDGDGTELMLDLLEKCGLRKDFAMEMEPEHLLIVVEKLLPAKKK